MTFDIEEVFLVAGPSEIVSMAATGMVLGYLFAGRMSAHLTMFAYAFRTFVVGFVFLGGMMATRFLGGAPRYEVWLGIMAVFLVYTAGLSVGIAFYDRQFKKAVEAELGRELRANPRGTFRLRGKK